LFKCIFSKVMQSIFKLKIYQTNFLFLHQHIKTIKKNLKIHQFNIFQNKK